MRYFSIFLAAFFYTANCMALLSIAVIPGQSKSSFYLADNFEYQQEADRVALEGCRAQAKSKGLGHLAQKCIITDRGAKPGYGAFSCGDDGCSYSLEYREKQDAQNAAYRSCAGSFVNCVMPTDFWIDTSGYKQATSETNCIPTTRVRSCTSQCFNGDCVVTYSNGCQVRVQVSPQYNSSSSKWEYPYPDC